MSTSRQHRPHGPNPTGPAPRMHSAGRSRDGSPARRRPEVVAREHTGDYHHDGAREDRNPGQGHAHDADHDHDRHDGGGDVGEVGPSVPDQVRAARRALEGVLTAVSETDAVQGGELAGLLELLGALDVGHAAAVELTGMVQRAGVAERNTSLPLGGLLAFQSRATHAERAALAGAAEQLPTMPHLRRAFHAGVVGWAQVRAILAEARPLTALQRAELDAGFADLDRIGRWEADVLVDTVADAVAALRPDLDRDRTRRVIEHRFLALQPALDGAGTGYFELDPAAFAPVAEALHAAMPAPSGGPADITRHAPDHTDQVVRDEVVASSPDGDPAFCDPVLNRSRARQRADALVRLAEVFLGGQPTTRPADTPSAEVADGADTPHAARTVPLSGPLGRARPSLQAICDIGHLTGHDEAARAAQALVATIGRPVRLTPDTVRRLACDAKLQVVFTDQGQILGTSDPTDNIPVAVRRAVTARDRGCRFPGCSAPIHWADLHHITYRSNGGPTTPDNLVALCRRHHTAVHEGGWNLTLAPDGTVTIKRGRRTHTSDPPWRRTLLPH